MRRKSGGFDGKERSKTFPGIAKAMAEQSDKAIPASCNISCNIGKIDWEWVVTPDATR